MGLADFITADLRSNIDEKKTLINTLTTGDMLRAKIPVTMKDEKELVETISNRFGNKRWMWIPNTLHLETLYASPDLTDEIDAIDSLEILDNEVGLCFNNGRHNLEF